MLYPYHRWYIHIIISVIYPSVLQFHWRFQSPILFQYKTSTHSKNQDMEAEHGPFLEETVFFFLVKSRGLSGSPRTVSVSQWWEIFPTTWGFSPIFDPYFKVYTLDHFILCALDSRCTATTPVGFLLSFCDKFFFFWVLDETFSKTKDGLKEEVGGDFSFCFRKKQRVRLKVFAWKTKNWKLNLRWESSIYRTKLRELRLEVDGRSVVTLWDSKENFAPIFRFYCGCEAGNNLFPKRVCFFFSLWKTKLRVK